jgi:hypothetical protein
MEHKHNDHSVNNSKQKMEYLKFVGIMLSILGISIFIAANTALPFLESFMGVFFIQFASFKLAQLKEFAYGFQSYDLLAKRSLKYSYFYPFMQFGFGVLYIAGAGSLYLDVAVLVVSLVSGAGVLNSLIKKQKVHCVCLGNVIKLPLSTISFVEDFGMAAMAIVMIFLR